MNNCLRKAQAFWNDIDRMFRSERPHYPTPINKIVINGAVDFVYSPLPDQRLVVAGDTQALADSVKIRLEGRVLHIERVDSNDYLGSKKNGRSFFQRIGLFFMNLLFGRQCTTHESSRVIVGISQAFAPYIVHQGAGEVCLANMNQRDFEMRIDGSVKACANGAVEKLMVQISGSADFLGEDLSSKKADLSISGAGCILVGAAESVSSKISGAGNITVFGNPYKKSQSISGAGTVVYPKEFHGNR